MDRREFLNVLAIASSIKAVIDYNATLAQSDTLALAQAVAAGSQTADTTYTSNIQSDPVLSSQLNSTTSTVATATSMRSVITSRAFYEFGYEYYFSQMGANPVVYSTIAIKADGSGTFKESKFDGTNWIVYSDESDPVGTFQWSSDGNTMFMVGDVELPAKLTLLSKETITTNGVTADLYFIRHEVTADGTEGFFTNFAATASHQGSYDATTKRVSLTYDNGSTNTFYLNGSGSGFVSYDGINTTSIPWETITRYGK